MVMAYDFCRKEYKRGVRIPKLTAKKLMLIVCSVFLTLAILEIGMRIWINNFAGERRSLKYASLRQLEKRYSDIKPR
jgi:uncharacterized membrane protein